MIERLKHFVEEQHLFLPGQEVLLAVSGGRDSVCLAHLMRSAGYGFSIAHCNFHLRPDDCDCDQSFTRQLAERLQVPFYSVDFDTQTFAKNHGLSDEMAARVLRYRWFAGLCRLHSLSCVATGHHQDDSIETFFLNLFRGTGIAGLQGMRPRSFLSFDNEELTVVHPMLCFSRADIDRYVDEHGLSYVEDYTNALPEVRRNRLRLQVVPLLRDLYPSFDATMAKNMRRMAEVEAVYDIGIESLRNRFVKTLPPLLPTTPCPMVTVAFGELPEPRVTLLFEFLRVYGFHERQVRQMLSTNPACGALFYSSSHVATVTGDCLVVAPQCEPIEPVVDEVEGSRLLEQGEVLVDSDCLMRPLRVRRWEEGDRFCPLGMTRHRKVSDFLKDRKINRIERGHVWLLTDAAERIVWVIGLSIDNRFRITDNTCMVSRLVVSVDLPSR